MEPVHPVSGIVSTRERILEVAGPIFADRGRRDATIREIVQQAGVNQAAVNYHFRDKEGLYAEVLRHGVQTALDRHPPDGGVSAEATAAQRLHGVISATLHRYFSAERKAWHGRLMMREFEDPSPAFLALMDEIVGRLMPLVDEIVGLINPGLDADQRWLCCHSVLSQCNSLPKAEFFFSRTRPAWDRLPKSERIEILTDHISRYCLAAIGGLT
ncbi:TetR/AcrR family transcriptional regulator [bacterium]|nr:TetR/AcrR family transcriptional regulator [bacterium]